MDTENKHSSIENNSPGLVIPQRNLPDPGPRESIRNERAEAEDETIVRLYNEHGYSSKNN
jgi:hypothetical protein